MAWVLCGHLCGFQGDGGTFYPFTHSATCYLFLLIRGYVKGRKTVMFFFKIIPHALLSMLTWDSAGVSIRKGAIIRFVWQIQISCETLDYSQELHTHPYSRQPACGDKKHCKRHCCFSSTLMGGALYPLRKGWWHCSMTVCLDRWGLFLSVCLTVCASLRLGLIQHSAVQQTQPVSLTCTGLFPLSGRCLPTTLPSGGNCSSRIHGRLPNPVSIKTLSHSQSVVCHYSTHTPPFN